MAILLNKWFVILFLTALIFANIEKKTVNAMHPYHVSATEIEFDAVQKDIEISSKLFIDDFEAVLTKIYKTKTDFADKGMKKQMDELVKRYIATHLAIRSNGKILPLQFVGWETEREAVYVYAKAPAGVFDQKNIMVENTILYDLFDDQMNIVHFILGRERKSAKLNYPERKIRFSF